MRYDAVLIQECTADFFSAATVAGQLRGWRIYWAHNTLAHGEPAPADAADAADLFGKAGKKAQAEPSHTGKRWDRLPCVRVLMQQCFQACAGPDPLFSCP